MYDILVNFFETFNLYYDGILGNNTSDKKSTNDELQNYRLKLI